MKENTRLKEEVNKMLFLSGVEDYLLEAKAPPKEPETETSEDDEEDTQENKQNELSSELETLEVNTAKQNDYLKTVEKDYLSFPMKVSMLVGSGENYKKLMSSIYQLLYLTKAYQMNLFTPGIIDDPAEYQRKTTQIIKEITKIVAPEFSETNIQTVEQALEMVSQNISKKANSFLNDKINKVNVNKELGEFLTLDAKRKYLEKIGAYEELKQILPSIENLKKTLYPNATDQKATISHNLGAKPNELKLSPQGFWQIQFLSRAAANAPKDELEEILLGNGRYIGLALDTLKDFYSNALFPMIAILTGRKFNLNPNDTEFKIIQDASWDKIKDGLVAHKYNTERGNFGAWAISVAKNAVIDEIKKITNIQFVNSFDVSSTLSEMGYDTLSFKKPLEQIIPKVKVKAEEGDKEKQKTEPVVDFNEYCSLVKSEEFDYTYKFFSPDHLFDFFNTIKTLKGEIPYSFISELTSKSKQLLKSIGAIKSVKKFADVWPEDQGEEAFDTYGKKASGESRNKLFKELYDFYKSVSKMSFSYDNPNVKETKEYENVVDTDEDGTTYRVYSDEELQDAFERDMGKALYFYQAEFAKNLPVLIEKIPSDSIKRFIENNIATMPETTDSEKIEKKEAIEETKKLAKKNKNDRIVASIFFKDGDISKGLVPELEPHVFYKYKEARDLEKGVVPYLRNEFVQQQEDEKNKAQVEADAKNMHPTPIYTFRDVDSVWQQVGYAISDFNLHKAKKDVKRKQMNYNSGREKALVEDTVNFISQRIFNLKLYEKNIQNQIFELKEVEKIPTTVRQSLIETQGKLNQEMVTRFLNEKNPGQDVIDYLNSNIKLTYIQNKKGQLEKSIEGAFQVDKKVKEMLASRRPNELRRLSKIFSGISGANIQLENKNNTIDEINNYLLEIKNNFITKNLL